MTQLIVLPHPENCPDGAVIEAEEGKSICETLLENGVDRNSLNSYAATRRLDREGSAFFTDRIVRTFSNDFGPLKLVRGLGLLALDVCPPARHFVAKRMIWGARAWP